MAIRLHTEFTGAGVTGGGLATHVFAGSDQTAADAAVAALNTFWGAVDAEMNSQVTWNVRDEAEVFDPVTGNTTAVLTVTGSSASGGVGGSLLPLTTQALIRWRTGVFVSGREIRGRTFVPGLPETANAASGKPEATTVTNLTNAAAALVTGSDLQVWSQTHGQVATVTASSVWSEWASLRSRRD